MGETAGWQPKLQTTEGMRVEAAAYYMLSRVMGASIAKKVEFGGVIYRDEATKRIHANGPFQGKPMTGPDAGESVSVYIGQHEVNLGLAATLTPLAWYHTHPLKELSHLYLDTRDTKPAQLAWAEFIGGDKKISDYRQIFGYVATMDGRFWRYNPPAQVLDDNYGPGRWGPVNFPPIKFPSKEVLPIKTTWW